VLKVVPPREPKIDPASVPILGQPPKGKEFVCPKCGCVATLPVGQPGDTAAALVLALGNKGAAFCVKCLVEFWATSVPSMVPLVKDGAGEKAGE
jgi:hypothetical protein